MKDERNRFRAFKQIKHFNKFFNAMSEEVYNKMVLCKDLYNVKVKKSFGSTNPKMVAQAIRREEKLKRKGVV